MVCKAHQVLCDRWAQQCAVLSKSNARDACAELLMLSMH